MTRHAEMLLVCGALALGPAGALAEEAAGAGAPVLAQADAPPPAEVPGETPTPPPESAAPPAPPAEPPPAAAEPAPQAATDPAPPGHWVYTQQYGWIWMPYADVYTYAPPSGYGQPYMYVFYPDFGWTWIAAPWVWGYGPWPHFGVYGAVGFSWYSHGWWRHPARWHYRPGPVRGSFPPPVVRPLGRGTVAPRRELAPAPGVVRPQPRAGVVRPAPGAAQSAPRSGTPAPRVAPRGRGGGSSEPRR